MRARLLVLAVAAAAALAGCGAQKLTASENSDVAKAEADLTALAAFGDKYADSLDDVDRLIELYRAKPKASYDGRTLREVLQDGASTLDRYQPDLAAKLDRAAR